jgi:hypothetical protein
MRTCDTDTIKKNDIPKKDKNDKMGYNEST